MVSCRCRITVFCIFKYILDFSLFFIRFTNTSLFTQSVWSKTSFSRSLLQVFFVRLLNKHFAFTKICASLCVIVPLKAAFEQNQLVPVTQTAHTRHHAAVRAGEAGPDHTPSHLHTSGRWLRLLHAHTVDETGRVGCCHRLVSDGTAGPPVDCPAISFKGSFHLLETGSRSFMAAENVSFADHYHFSPSLWIKLN